MPIRINLLADALAEEDLRRRDPVKRAIIVGSLLVAVVLVWFSSIWLETLLANKKLGALDAEIQTRTTEYANVLADQKKNTDMQKRLESLQKLSAARFLQGNLMDAFQKIYTPNVQVTRLRLDQSYSINLGSPGVTNKFGVVPGKPSFSTEHVLLILDAKDLSTNPGDQVNRYKDALVTQSFFKSALDRTNGVRLSNLSAPQSSLDSKPFVVFTLECNFSDKTR